MVQQLFSYEVRDSVGTVGKGAGAKRRSLVRLISEAYLRAGACISPAGAERLPAGLWPEDILLNTEMSERRGRRRSNLKGRRIMGHIQRNAEAETGAPAR